MTVKKKKSSFVETSLKTTVGHRKVNDKTFEMGVYRRTMSPARIQFFYWCNEILQIYHFFDRNDQLSDIYFCHAVNSV